MITAILIGKLIILSGIIGLVSWGITDMRVVPHKIENEKLKTEIQNLEIEKILLIKRNRELIRRLK